MCPGRHSAAAEVLSLSAVMILGFDLEMVDNSAWNPPPDRKRISLSAIKPLEKLVVRMQRRKDFESVEWKLEL